VGLAAGEILAVGADPAEVAVTLCRELRAGAGPRDPGDLTRPSSCNQLIAVYAGRDASDDDAGRVGSALQEAFPDLEVEVRRGDQPHYPYLIGIE
jgi:dihydroxyacetone kinase-like predicted kinase